LNTLSLFDGISTGRYCLDQAGIQVDNYFSSEINPSAIKISEKNYPDIIRLGDVTTIDTIDLPRIDLLIGGSPCQGFSRAGKCLNFEDPRSKLFFEYVRILNEIREYNPDVKFLLENVVMKKEWEDVISEHLGVKPVKINSRDFSGQYRLRLYWSNIPLLPYEPDTINLIDIIEDNPDKDYIEHEGILFDPTINESRRELCYMENGELRIKQATKLGYIVAEDGDGVCLDYPTSTTRRGRVIKGKSPTLTTKGDPLVFYKGVIRPLMTFERERLQTLPDNYTECEGVSISARNEALGNGWTAAVITHYFRGLKV